MLAGSTLRHEIADVEADVSRNLAEETWRDVATRVVRDRCDPPVRMAELLVRSALANLCKSEADQDREHLARVEDRDVRHALRHANGVGSDELGLKARITVLKQHAYDLAEVLVQFIQRGCLGVSAGPSWHVADEQAGGGITLDHGSERTHGRRVARLSPPASN
jgi:DNA-binding transcriptional LysR family regulator